MNVLTILSYTVKAYISSILFFPLVSVWQEYKIWKHPAVPSLSPLGMFKVYMFNAVWMGMAFIGTLLLLPKYLLNGCGGVERDTNSLVERLIGFTVVSMFVGPVKVRGREKLPPINTPCVFIANHASQIDLAVVYFLFQNFRWIAKKSVKTLPGVGTIMLLGGHIFIDRHKGKKKSAKKMYETSKHVLDDDVSIFIFPQGTRRMAERLPFKDGAFNIAMSSEVPLIPITIEIPVTAWAGFYPLNMLWKKKAPVILTVHDRVEVTKDSDKEELKKNTYETIHSILPLHTIENATENDKTK